MAIKLFTLILFYCSLGWSQLITPQTEQQEAPSAPPPPPKFVCPADKKEPSAAECKEFMVFKIKPRNASPLRVCIEKCEDVINQEEELRSKDALEMNSIHGG